jgi:hypothetical protein
VLAVNAERIRVYSLAVKILQRGKMRDWNDFDSNSILTLGFLVRNVCIDFFGDVSYHNTGVLSESGHFLVEFGIIE